MNDSMRVGNCAIPLDTQRLWYARVLERIGDAEMVLLGEATHGTHEFYHVRAEITKRLIEEKGFSVVAVEADWPDAYRVNRFVHGIGDATAREALGDFKRFPSWMWRNKVVEEFVAWLYEHNRSRSYAQKTSFYGLDLYSLHASCAAVIAYLETVDPEAAHRARMRYECFDRFGTDAQAYGYATRFNLAHSCKREVIAQLVALRTAAAKRLHEQGYVAHDAFFCAERNAIVVKNAECYYRSLFMESGESSWNIRDRHMMDTVRALMQYHTGRVAQPKLVIWAHNSHIGNAAATDMARYGEINIGQLVRAQYGVRAVSIGFTTYTGTVSAASAWDGGVERKFVRTALPESYEALFHTVPLPDYALILNSPELAPVFKKKRLERAIGVLYKPETERSSHYFYADISAQFDVVIHCDVTRAVEPLERTSVWEAGEFPETFPSGM